MTSNSELRKIIKYITFMKMTTSLSKLSYDPKHQVASLIVKNDWSEINSMGYNGNYSGAPNIRSSIESGKSKFIHAEMNALLFCTLSKEDAKNYTIFVTMTPCELCARLIVNKGIKNVIVLNKYDNCGDSLNVFENSGITFHYLDKLIMELYEQSELLSELIKIIGDNLNYIVPIDTNIDLLDSELLKCFKKQMGYFFEFDNSFEKTIPDTIIKNLDDFSKYNSEAILRHYLKLFIDILSF